MGDHPFDVAVAPDGSEVYVSNRDSGTVSVIDAATNTVMTIIPVGDQPLSLAISPDGTLVYVSRHDDDIVSVIDTATLAVTSFPTADPLGVAFTPDSSRAYVVNHFLGGVTVIDTATNTPSTFIDLGAAFSFVIDTATNTVVDVVPVNDVWGLAITPDGEEVYVTNVFSDTVTVIETATNTVVATVPVGDWPESVSISPDGTRAYVVLLTTDKVTVIDTATRTVMGTIPVGDAPIHIATTPPSAGPTFPASKPAVVSGSVNWSFRGSLSAGDPPRKLTYGAKPLVPLTGDWDGNGSKTPGTFERGVFRLANTMTEENPVMITFGILRGYPVAGDFDGDGTDDLAVYTNGTWEVRYSDGTMIPSFNFGAGLLAVDRARGRRLGRRRRGWHRVLLPQQRHLDPPPDGEPTGVDVAPFQYWAGSGSYPVVGDWSCDGIDTVGVKQGSTWSLRNTNGPGDPDIVFDYGLPQDLPLTWR